MESSVSHDKQQYTIVEKQASIHVLFGIMHNCSTRHKIKYKNCMDEVKLVFGAAAAIFSAVSPDVV